MNFRLGLAFLMLAGLGMAQEAGLPEWIEADRALLKKGEKGGLIPGAFLLTNERPPEQAAEPPPEPLAVVPPTADEIAGDRHPFTWLPEPFWEAYFAERPKAFLVDPQKLLKTDEHQRRLQFLEEHAADSTIDFYVYLFDGPQSIPSELRVEELIERFFQTGRHTAVVFYYFGSPEKTELRLNPALGDLISQAEQRRGLMSSVTVASDKSGAAEQLEAFCQQFSIRLYWMERVIHGSPKASPVEAVSVKPKTEILDARKAKMLELAREWQMPVAAGAGGLLTLFALGAWWKTKAKYRFPEFDVEGRLGGEHAAGIGAVISFTSASLPPGVQREQVPDYLHRA